MSSHPHGLFYDLNALARTSAARRGALRWLGAGALAGLPLLGCGGGGGESSDVSSSSSSSSTSSSSTSSSSSTTTTTTPTSCATIPSETAGPYPGDGTNTANGSVANALVLSGIVRSDIRTSVGGASGTALGVPLTVTLQLASSSGGCAALSGYAVYLWHCTRDGLYSMYSSGVTGENFLRGVQVSDANGKVTFTTVFPGCYAGRMPHIHFEVYASLATATGLPAGDQVRTSQIALPTATCQEVYAVSGYGSSASNLNQISFASDNVFSDGTSLQMATVSGSTSAGYAANLVVGIA